MSAVRMTGELRTDSDDERAELPSERGKAVLKIKDEEVVPEVSMGNRVTIAMMGG